MRFQEKGPGNTSTPMKPAIWGQIFAPGRRIERPKRGSAKERSEGGWGKAQWGEGGQTVSRVPLRRPAASPGAGGGARWPRSSTPTYPVALRLLPERCCDPGFRGATQTGSARGPGARPAGRSTGDRRCALMEHRCRPRLQRCGSVDWGLSYHTPCRMESWGAPKGINGGLG